MIAVFKHIPGAALIFAVVPLLVLGYLGWYFYGAEHVDKHFYSLKKSSLQVTKQPAWIRTDVVEKVFADKGLEKVSLLDPSANATIAHAFENSWWVKSATRVTKSPEGVVSVDLVYRHPAAMVHILKEGKHSFFPIDPDGVVLPTEDFRDDDIWNYFHIYAQNAAPETQNAGLAYTDPRIFDAVSLCELLEESREELGLEEIEVRKDEWSVGSRRWMLLVYTKDRIVINWGHAPGKETNGEMGALNKISRMKSWLAQTRLRSPGEQDANQFLDLRSPESASNSVPVSTTLQRP